MRTLTEAIRYPVTSEDWIRTILIGGILSFLGFLLIPILLVYGYLMGVIRESRADTQGLPTFGDWGTLLVDGVKAFLIGVVYMLIPLIVGTVTVGASLLAMLTGTDAGLAIGLNGLFLGLVGTGILTIVFGYVAVAGIVHFALEERFGAAFDLGSLKPVLLHRDYAVAWLLSVLVLLAAGFINGLLAEITFGTVIGAFVGFYAAIVAAVLWGDGFSDAAETPETMQTQPVDETIA